MHTNRRNVLKTMAGASLVSLTGLGPVEARAGERAAFRIALQTYSLKEFGLHYLLPVVKHLGFERIEAFDRQLSVHSSAIDLAAAIADLDANRTRIASFYTDVFENDDMPTHSIFAFGAKLGVELFSTGREPQALVAANTLSETYGIPVALHNASPGPGKHYVTPEAIDASLSELKHLKVCADIGNFARAGVDPADAIRHFGPSVVEVHFKDVDANGRHRLLGDGIIDLDDVVDALHEIDFTGLVTLEYGGEPDDLTRRIENIGENAKRLRTLLG